MFINSHAHVYRVKKKIRDTVGSCVPEELLKRCGDISDCTAYNTNAAVLRGV